MPRLGTALKFRIERWIQRGVPHQLLFVSALLALAAAGGGLLAWALGGPFDGPLAAIWWAFLRLTDPGYLGDDEGALLRFLSTGITVLGYVLFMGSLIAILTQWLARTLRTLEAGLTPITMRDHVVVLGWTNRTAEIVRELLGAKGRLARFLDRRSTRDIRVVIQSEEVDAVRRLDLRDDLGGLWSERRIFLRSGSALQIEHLERLDLRRAAAVIVPGADFELGGAEMSDIRVVKALLTIDQALRGLPAEERPLIVAEILDSEKLHVARGACEGPLELVASQALLARLISQGVRHRRLMPFYLQLLTHRAGSSLYVRDLPLLAGATPGELQDHFPRAIVLGFVRPEGGGFAAELNPPADARLADDGLVVLLAESWDDCEPESAVAPSATDVPGPTDDRARAPRPVQEPLRQRILVLGWSSKVPSILDELASCPDERFEVTLLSRHPIAEREPFLAHHPGVSLRHVEDDYTRGGVLAAAEPAAYDTIVLLASGGMSTSEEADARTILGHVLLRWILREAHDPPEVLVELLDPANARLFPGGGDVLVVSPRIVSHVLAHVALRRELHAVYEALFVAGGAEVTIRRAADYGLAESGPSPATLAGVARARGETVLGAAASDGRLRIGPLALLEHPPSARDEIVVLAGQAGTAERSLRLRT